MQLIIKSPVGFDPAVYNWPPENQDNSGASEIIETIKCVYEDLPELNTLFRKESLYDYDSKSYESMRLLCELYNKAIDRILDNNPSLHQRTPKRPSINLVQHIIHQAYNQSVIDPDKLNQYKPFSPEVYGETSFEFVRQMIEEIRIKDEDVFVDLGSGVGQVVLQVAALTNAKLCVGIEKAEVPAAYSEGMSDAFKFWMQWYGKQYCEYQLMKGDFFSEKYRDTINNGTFIFVNNFAFGPAVDNDLKLRFQELKDGARIVSSKAFCPLNFRITDRTLSDIGSIMRVEEIQPKYKKSVSWTGKPVSYYLHEIDRRKLEEFFSNSKIPKNKTNDNEMAKNRRNSNKSLSNNNHSTADQSSNDSSKFSSKDDSPVYGPTTRKAWSEYIKTAKTDTQAPLKEHLHNGNHHEQINNLNNKRELSTSDLTDVNKLMTSDSEDTSDTLIDDKIEKQRICSKTRKSTSEKRLNKQTNEQVSSPNNQNNNNINSSFDKRPPGRPRKSKTNDKTKRHLDSSLDLLHEKTVLSISSTIANEIPQGCFDSKLSTFEETHLDNLRDENIENKQQNMVSADDDSPTVEEQTTPQPKYPHLEYNLTIDSLVNNFRSQIVSFLNYSKTDDYKQNILDNIEKEKKLQTELKNRINMVESQIGEQLAKGVQALKSKLAQVDIYPDDPDDMMLKASEMIERNKELHSKVRSMESNVMQLELLHKKLNQIHLTNQKVNNSYDNLNNINQMNNMNNLTSLNNMKNMNNKLNTNSSKANSKTTKKSTTKQMKDANKVANQQTNSHLNSQLNQMVNHVTDNNSLSKSSPLNNASTFQQNQHNQQQQQQTINNPPYYNNQSLSNLNNIGSLTNLNNLNTGLNNLNNNLANNLNNVGLNNNNLSNAQQINYETSNLANSLSSKSTPTSNLSQNNSLSSTPSHNNNLSANALSTTHDKHLDRIKEKVNKSKCNTNLIKNDHLSNSNSIPTPIIMNNNCAVNQTKSNRKDSSATVKLNGITHQFPDFEEDVIKRMIEAAFDNDDGSNINAKNVNNMNNTHKSPAKPRKPRQPRTSKNAANKNQNNNDLTNHSNSSLEQTNKQSVKSFNNSQSALAYEQPKIYSTAATDFSSLFQNLHNSHVTTSNSFLSSKKSSNSTPSNPPSSSEDNRNEPNAIKLTLKKIDRERDSYTLVKSPPKSPEKISIPIIEHSKRKHNISPDHKTKKSKSPKYTSSINSSGAYEQEKRLILKLTNMSH